MLHALCLQAFHFKTLKSSNGSPYKNFKAFCQGEQLGSSNLCGQILKQFVVFCMVRLLLEPKPELLEKVKKSVTFKSIVAIANEHLSSENHHSNDHKWWMKPINELGVLVLNQPSYEPLRRQLIWIATNAIWKCECRNSSQEHNKRLVELTQKDVSWAKDEFLQNRHLLTASDKELEAWKQRWKDKFCFIICLCYITSETNLYVLFLLLTGIEVQASAEGFACSCEINERHLHSTQLLHSRASSRRRRNRITQDRNPEGISFSFRRVRFRIIKRQQSRSQRRA